MNKSWLDKIRFKLFLAHAIKKGVKSSVKKYKKTYELLEKYDKGEVSSTKKMAEYRDLRRSLRNTEKSASS